MDQETLDRSVRFFGLNGQRSICDATVLFAGVGGLGSFAVQLAALHRVGAITLVENGELKKSNLGRYATARHDDPIPGTRKVQIAKRMVDGIDSNILVRAIDDSIISERGLAAIKEADAVVGCVDREGVRLQLLMACAKLKTPYLDLATEIHADSDRLRYGGRVCTSFFGDGCLACKDVLDQDEASRDLAGENEVAYRRQLYGVDIGIMGDSGPSVASLNAGIAGLGMMELTAYLSGLRDPQPHLNYNAATGKVGLRSTRLPGSCYYCDGLFAGRQSCNLDELAASRSN